MRRSGLRSARERLLAILLLLAASPAALAVGDVDYAFRVLLEDREIGTHRFSVRNQGGERIVDVEADFDVRVLFVPVYRYAHRNRETWEGGCLRTLASRTDDNGLTFAVEARSDSDGLRVDGRDVQANLDGCVRTFAYWDPAFLEADALLNPQTGRYVEVEIEREGQVDLDLGGALVAADQWRIRGAGALDICLWYANSDGRWLGLETRREGRLIRYVPADADRLEVARATG